MQAGVHEGATDVNYHSKSRVPIILLTTKSLLYDGCRSRATKQSVLTAIDFSPTTCFHIPHIYAFLVDDRETSRATVEVGNRSVRRLSPISGTTFYISRHPKHKKERLHITPQTNKDMCLLFLFALFLLVGAEGTD